ncbi:MAG TPA: hypothetical protein V6D14_13970 [Coleofasciculaceae cyanobacterium]
MLIDLAKFSNGSNFALKFRYKYWSSTVLRSRAVGIDTDAHPDSAVVLVKL